MTNKDRILGINEKTFWVLDQKNSTQFAVVAEILHQLLIYCYGISWFRSMLTCRHSLCFLQNGYRQGHNSCSNITCGHHEACIRCQGGQTG